MSWVSELIAGVAGTTGQAMTNKSNLKIAREQMAFQERMSSTAAQRSAKDYELAGLNPALAYDRPASSPGGASAVMGDSVGAGIATAQRAREVNAQQKVLKETARSAKAAADVANGAGVVEAQQTALRHEAQARTVTADLNREALERDVRFQSELQPVQLRTAILDEMMKRYSVQGLTRAAIQKLLPMVSASVKTARDAMGPGPAMKFNEAKPKAPPPDLKSAMRRMKP